MPLPERLGHDWSQEQRRAQTTAARHASPASAVCPAEECPGESSASAPRPNSRRLSGRITLAVSRRGSSRPYPKPTQVVRRACPDHGGVRADASRRSPAAPSTRRWDARPLPVRCQPWPRDGYPTGSGQSSRPSGRCSMLASRVPARTATSCSSLHQLTDGVCRPAELRWSTLGGTGELGEALGERHPWRPAQGGPRAALVEPVRRCQLLGEEAGERRVTRGG